MPNNSNATKRQPEPQGFDQAEARVLRALETLRLLNDENNPLSLRQAIARARELAATYTLWEQSGAPLKDIVVRLPDGQEIAMDQSKAASLCGFHFRELFPPDAVLHVWKKADEEFGEVQLLSLALRDVRAGGYSCKRTYKNGQTLSLKVERCADGQFHISVDCAAKQQAASPSRKLRGWLPLLAPAVMALSRLSSFLFKPRPPYRPRWALRPGAAFAAGVMITTAACLLLLLNAAGGDFDSKGVAPVVTEQGGRAPAFLPGSAEGPHVSAMSDAGDDADQPRAGGLAAGGTVVRTRAAKVQALRRAILAKAHGGAPSPAPAPDRPAPGLKPDSDGQDTSAATVAAVNPEEFVRSGRRAGVVVVLDSARACDDLLTKGGRFLMRHRPWRNRPAAESATATYGMRYRGENDLLAGPGGWRGTQRYVPGRVRSGFSNGGAPALLPPNVSARASDTRSTTRATRTFAN